MNEREKMRQTRFEREKLLLRYADALEQDNLDVVAAILEQAQHDPELDRGIWEVHLAMSEELLEREEQQIQEHQVRNEEQIIQIADSHIDSPVVRTPQELAKQSRSLTIGDLAGALCHRMGWASDQKQRLLFWEKNEEPIVIPKSEREVRSLLARFGMVNPAKSLVNQVQQVLFALGMQMQGREVRLAAARRQKTVRERPDKPYQSETRKPSETHAEDSENKETP